MERKDYIATIQELLKGRNEEFDKADVERIRLIRHKDSRKEKNIGGNTCIRCKYAGWHTDNCMEIKLCQYLFLDTHFCITTRKKVQGRGLHRFVHR